MVMKMFSAKMGITSGGLYFENPLLDCTKGIIEGSSAKIEDEDVTFTSNLSCQWLK